MTINQEIIRQLQIDAQHGIASRYQIIQLVLRNKEITDNELSDLIKLLKVNTTLRFLDLSGNLITSDGASMLAQLFYSYKTYEPGLKAHRLSSLDLSRNRISREGVRTLARALEEDESLSVLMLDENKVRAFGAVAIAKMLEKNKRLSILHLKNTDITDRGGIALAQALEKNNRLEVLDLSHNPITDEAAKAIAKMLKKNKSLNMLFLNNCNITQQGLTTILDALKENTTLTNLSMHGNPLEDADKAHVAELLAANFSLLDFSAEYNLKNLDILTRNRILFAAKERYEGRGADSRERYSNIIDKVMEIPRITKNLDDPRMASAQLRFLSDRFLGFKTVLNYYEQQSNVSANEAFIEAARCCIELSDAYSVEDMGNDLSDPQKSSLFKTWLKEVKIVPEKSHAGKVADVLGDLKDPDVKVGKFIDAVCLKKSGKKITGFLQDFEGKQLHAEEAQTFFDAALCRATGHAEKSLDPVERYSLLQQACVSYAEEMFNLQLLERSPEDTEKVFNYARSTLVDKYDHSDIHETDKSKMGDLLLFMEAVSISAPTAEPESVATVSPPSPK